jgi:cyanophycinase
MSDSMLTGNQYRAPPDTNGYYGDEYDSIARHFIEVVPGLGFLSGAIVDQHFITRERHNRLLSVVLERPTLIGVGIDEGTALEVEPGGGWRVLGASAVVVYDVRAARSPEPRRRSAPPASGSTYCRREAASIRGPAGILCRNSLQSQ